MGNTFGSRLRVTIFGQSHAPAIGAVIDGLPAGMKLDMQRIHTFMARRAPGGSALSTARSEADIPRIIAGLNERGETCGAPLCAVIENGDVRSGDYERLREVPRPGHADATANLKYGAARDVRGGGQFSGRLTAPLCFAGAVCAQLPALAGVRVGAHLLSVGQAEDTPFEPMGMDEAALDRLARAGLPVLDESAGARMRDEILSAKREGDSVGGVIEAIAQGVPGGLGEPMFDGVENRLSQILFAIPAVRGVSFGLGFEAARLRGSQHNDGFEAANAGPVSNAGCAANAGPVPNEHCAAIANGAQEAGPAANAICPPHTNSALGAGGIRTLTNRHGGVLGGITSGMPILVRVAIKPTPSIAKEQASVSLATAEAVKLSVTGRHDPCIAPRAVPCVEAALWIALADMML